MLHVLGSVLPISPTWTNDGATIVQRVGMSPYPLQAQAENRSNRLEPLCLAVRVLHFVEHVTESVDSLFVPNYVFGYPFVGPGENSDVSIEGGFGSWSFAMYDLVGPGPGVCPGCTGNREAKEKH